MKALPADQLLLLELQNVDSTIARLKHRRDAHPAHRTLAELQGRFTDLKRAAVAQSAVISDIQRQVDRLDQETTKVRDRRSLQQGRLDRNEVPLRDFSPMQHEIQRMDQRISDLEGEQLEAEERLEAATRAAESMKRDATGIAQDVEKAKQQFAADMLEVDQELVKAEAHRAQLIPRIPAELVNEYEQAQRAHGVLAVVEVRDGRVMGGGADFSPVEMERIRTLEADEMYWGEETGQIVVRTHG